MPTTKATLFLFVTHLTTQNMAYTTIKVYLAAVHSTHAAAGKYNIFEDQFTYCLLKVIKGMPKQTAISNPPRIRLPITTKILQKINTVLSSKPDTYLK